MGTSLLALATSCGTEPSKSVARNLEGGLGICNVKPGICAEFTYAAIATPTDLPEARSLIRDRCLALSGNYVTDAPCERSIPGGLVGFCSMSSKDLGVTVKGVFIFSGPETAKSAEKKCDLMRGDFSTEEKY